MNDRCWFTAAEALTGHDEPHPRCRVCSRRQIRHDRTGYMQTSFTVVCSPTARMAEGETSQQRKDVVTHMNPTHSEDFS